MYRNTTFTFTPSTSICSFIKEINSQINFIIFKIDPLEIDITEIL